MFKNENYQISTPSGFQIFDGIKKSSQQILKFVCENNIEIEVSYDHKFFKNDKIYLAHTLKVGDELFHKTSGLIEILGIENKESDDVYELMNVNNGNVYYGNDILHHNCVEFLGSVSTVIDPEVLKRLIVSYEAPIQKDLEGSLSVYENPLKGAKYIVGVDVAKGTGKNYSSIQVLRLDSVKPIKMKQVAAFNNNLIDVYKFAEAVHRVALYYNKAHVMVENNNEGAAIVNSLWWDFEYQNLYNTGSKIVNLGIRATRSTKPKAVLFMKKLIEDFSLELVDETTIAQLTDFIEEKNGSFKCENLNDDLVSALYWASYFLLTPYFDGQIEFEKATEPEEDIWGIISGVDKAEDWGWLDDTRVDIFI